MDRRTVLKSTHIQQKIAEKKAELENLNEIKKFTSILTNQLDELENKLDYMAEGTESVALVLSNWQNVVKSVSLASLGLLKYSEKDYETGAPLPECLVRIKLDKDDNVGEEIQEKEEMETDDYISDQQAEESENINEEEDRQEVQTSYTD
ncbi:DEHA2C06138p [Debaryomyces hansenii CBS767]|uniref:DASH complex subunit DAD2 n=1 Tax=Debaryomyces hansenii (strain ATCC 36239 / CBS 767 / BCRC 21394 / JCM 1990 / NBRC 0083 / IGC 2968) TaxID=284592 RepID=DAD2_DEBHA|nr:DEHA2C06138p [Debaryomyces hansenii CBS767]Q6BV14.2 RecName: Full=DASH complex subunit DAD2; AltName: Full=Outer kinetochore protein DAD2 [Debaryomyces hansenii CBS767]CAG86011.2 DEHA2C06138p [Debaryomyces hansenii CBS767]|eukprot:XP_457955.2 DEHA2C06138p [Debaryomyces hansenii CBS767]